MNAKKDTRQRLIDNTLLEQYKQVYEMYKHATRLIKEDNLDSAEVILQEIFHDNDALQIPIEIYKTYILLLLTNKKEKQAKIFLSNAPDEIKYAGEMIQIKQKYNLEIERESINSKKRISTKALYSLIGLLLIGLAIFGIIKSDLFSKEKNVTTEENSNLSKKQESEVQKSSTKKETNDKQDKNINNSTNQNHNTTSDSLKPTNVVNQSVAAYEKGFELFQTKQYEQAIEEFKISYTLDHANYSSDDALYYLILSEQRMNAKANVNPTISKFMNQSNDFFKSSPYYDDLLIMKAESLIKDKNYSDAEGLLNEVVRKYSKEWTANKAKNLLEGLKK